MMVMQYVAARNSRVFLAGRIRKRPDAGKTIADIGLANPGAWKQSQEALKQIVNFFERGLRIIRTLQIGDLGGADQDLAVPGNHEDLAAIGGFGIDGL